LWVEVPAIPAIFQSRISKEINKALSGRIIVICSVQRLLWHGPYKGVDCALTLDVDRTAALYREEARIIVVTNKVDQRVGIL